MKLRIHGQSLRFRLGRAEVDALFEGWSLEERVEFGPPGTPALVYRIAPDQAVGALPRAELQGASITLHVPAASLKLWRDGGDLGLEAEQSWPGGTLRLLLEKDLQRLNPKAGEEPGDVFPHPLFGKKRCDHA